MPGTGRLVLGLVAVLSVSGCGYTAGSLLRGDVHTVAVGIFENETFRRGLELELTRALKSELRTRTHLVQVQPAQAESTLEGVITQVEERVLSEDEDDRVLLERVTVTVAVRWIRSDGEVLADLPRVRASADFATGRGEDAALGSRRALSEVARRIVLLLEDTSW
jgi:hypothetical protein